MIISVTIDNLLEISVIYLISNLMKSGEIHRGSRYRKNFAGCHARTVDRSIIRSVYIQILVTDVVSRVSGKIEI